MVYLSKSKYCGLWQCPKIAWLRKYKPETSRLDDSVLARMEAGNEVGALARSLSFGRQGQILGAGTAFRHFGKTGDLAHQQIVVTNRRLG